MFPFVQRLISWPVRWLFFKSARQGAQTVIHCAVSEGIEKHSGKFFADCKPVELTNPQTMDNTSAEQLWKISAEMVGHTPIDDEDSGIATHYD